MFHAAISPDRARRLLAVAAAAALIGAIRLLLTHEGLPNLWLQTIFEVDRHLTYAELLHYTLLFILGLPAALLLGSAVPDAAYEKLRTTVQRLGYLAPAILAGGGAFCISRFVTHHAWFTDDEQAYLFQMRGYRELKLAVPALQPEALFHHPFVVVTRVKEGVQYWAGTYPVLQPAMMTLSSFLGQPLLSQWFATGLISHQAGLLAERLSRDRGTGLLTAWLCASSPMLIGLGATYHTAVLTCLLSVLSARALLWSLDGDGFGRGAALGLCTGATFLTRGAEGTLVFLTAGGFLAWFTVRDLRRRYLQFCGFALAGAVAGGVYMACNLAITGHALMSAYTVWGQLMGRFFGFGTNMSWGRVHSPRHGLGQTVVSLVRMNTWLFGWPISLFVAGGSLAAAKVPRWVVWLAILSAAHLAFYSLINFGSVHDFGSAYHVWHVPVLAALAAFAIRSAEKFVRIGSRVALAMTVVALFAFWPTQVRKWRVTAHTIWAPVVAAQQATAGEPAIVLWSTVGPRSTTWVHYPPMSFPSNPLWWAIDAPGAEDALRAAYPNRALLRLSWSGDQPVVSRLP